MKKLLLRISLLLVLVLMIVLDSACSSSGGATPTPTPTPGPILYTLTATWDKNAEPDIDYYQLFEVVNGNNVPADGHVPQSEAPHLMFEDVPGGDHTYVVTATNSAGLTSAPSAPATVHLPLPPNAPANLHFSIQRQP